MPATDTIAAREPLEPPPNGKIRWATPSSPIRLILDFVNLDAYNEYMGIFRAAAAQQEKEKLEQRVKELDADLAKRQAEFPEYAIPFGYVEPSSPPS